MESVRQEGRSAVTQLPEHLNQQQHRIISYNKLLQLILITTPTSTATASWLSEVRRGSPPQGLLQDTRALLARPSGSPPVDQCVTDSIYLWLCLRSDVADGKGSPPRWELKLSKQQHYEFLHW